MNEEHHAERPETEEHRSTVRPLHADVLVDETQDVVRRQHDYALNHQNDGRGDGRVLLKQTHYNTDENGPERRVVESSHGEEEDARATHTETNQKEHKATYNTSEHRGVVAQLLDERTRNQTTHCEDHVHRRGELGDVLLVAVTQHVDQIQRRPRRTALLRQQQRTNGQ